jgi:hypothetical protein
MCKQEEEEEISEEAPISSGHSYRKIKLLHTSCYQPRPSPPHRCNKRRNTREKDEYETNEKVLEKRKKERKGKKTNRNRSEAIAVEEDSSGNKHKKQQCRSHHSVCHPLRCPASPHTSSPDRHCIQTTKKQSSQKNKKETTKTTTRGGKPLEVLLAAKQQRDTTTDDCTLKMPCSYYGPLKA